jgi:hypothetical protein
MRAAQATRPKNQNEAYIKNARCVHRPLTRNDRSDMAHEQKALQALTTLQRRLDPKMAGPVIHAAPGQPVCEVRLDRLVIDSSGFPAEAVLRLPGFERTEGHLLRRREPEDFLPHRRLTRFSSTTSIREMVVLTERQSLRLPPCRITMIAEDQRGLQFADVCGVLELLPDAKTVLVEIAWDFSPDSVADGAFIRAHALFGKSRRRRVAEIRGYDSWGSRRGRKQFVRSYDKPEIRAHRLEIQLLAGLLEKLGISDIFDFQQLTQLLPDHVVFAKFDEQSVIARLRNNRFSATKTIHLIEKLDDHSDDLYAQCHVLHRFARMTNIRRAMLPLRENQLLEEALRDWLKKWPAAPARLGQKK